MILPLDPAEKLIIVPARVFAQGNQEQTILRLAIDTGSTSSMLNWHAVVGLGYDPAAVLDLVQTTTVSGVILSPRVTLERIEALGQERRSFPVVCHTLPQLVQG